MKAVLLFVTILSILVSPGVAQGVAEKKEPAKAATKPGSDAKNVTPAEVEKLLAQNPKPIVLDVRTADEFAAGHIAGAQNISSDDPEFAQKVTKLDASRPVIVHCGSGGRSSRSLPAIAQQKFPAIYHMNGGFSAWKSAGKPVEAGSKK